MNCHPNYPFCGCGAKNKKPCPEFVQQSPCEPAPQGDCVSESQLACFMSQISALIARTNELASRINDAGLTIEFRVTDQLLFQWRYAADESWTNLIDFNDFLPEGKPLLVDSDQSLSDVEKAQGLANLGLSVTPEGELVINHPDGPYKVNLLPYVTP